MLEIFGKNGYLDIPAILSVGMPFTLILTGRGVGKTFGLLDFCRREALEGRGRFAYMRRLQTQIDICAKPEFSPFKRLDAVRHYTTIVKSISKYSSGFFDDETGQLLGVGVALSTFGSLRGFDGSDITRIIFEECIPQAREARIKNEAASLWDAYETINRNRELEGQAPVQLVCIGNSNDSAADLLVDMGLVSRIERMKRKGTSVYIDRSRGLLLVVLTDSDIGEQKRGTALYTFLGKNSEYTAAALENSPAEEWGGLCRNVAIKEYNPFVAVGEICIYRHKSRFEFYVSGHVSGSPPRYGSGRIDLKRFNTRYHAIIWEAYMNKSIFFENTTTEMLLQKYLNP
jgi:hypothetical protein